MMNVYLSKKYLLRISSILLCALALYCMPALAFAQDTLVDIPGVGGTGNVSNYLNWLFYFLIGLGAIVAVIKIALAGISYMFTDVVTNKEGAKKDIQGALFGLLIILSTVLVLQTINPNLVSLEVLRNAGELTPTSAGSGPNNAGAAPVNSSGGSTQSSPGANSGGTSDGQVSDGGSSNSGTTIFDSPWGP